jgi:hypothetical protein
MGIEEHSARTRDALTEGLLVLNVQGPERCALNKILDGFRETPGPDPEPREHLIQTTPPRRPLGFRPPFEEESRSDT